jgi:hypothetical protein
MRKVKIAILRGKTSKAIAEALDKNGILIYIPRDACCKILDVYTENI